jgi:acyl-CoA synthetase (AMP-forming)/AMP-acid ligase II/acyl carrier protein
MKETVHSLLREAFRLHQSSDAIVAPGRQSLSYADLDRQLALDHAFFRRQGLGPRARIGVAVGAGPEGLVAILAAAAAASCAPLDPDLAVGALERLMVEMRIDGLVVAEGPASNAVRAARAAGIPLLLLTGSSDEPAGAHALKGESRTKPALPEWPDPEDISLIWHTSGTTGAPKIVPNEQWRICSVARERISRRGICSKDRCLIASTTTSAATVRTGLLPNLAAGAAVIHTSELSADKILSAIECLGPTYFMAPPALHSRLLEILERRSGKLKHRLRAIYSSFAEQSPQVRDRLELLLGVPMIVTYGMTEVGGITETPQPPQTAPPGSVGWPVSEVAIADDRGKFVPSGQEGEVWVRGPEVMPGYESPPEANRDAFCNGWFRTGDVGHFDERGFLYLTGRIKDAINRGGVKIFPSELEAALASHPAVREAAVFARRHPTLGEDVCAAVVFEEQRAVSEAEMRRFVRHQLSAAKVPTRIVATSSLPRNAAGKLQRADLAAFGQALLNRVWQPAEGPHEEQVTAIFRHVLRLDDIGRNDRFFDRGGDSLRAVELLERIKEDFGVSVSMDDLLENSSVSGLASVISRSTRPA